MMTQLSAAALVLLTLQGFGACPAHAQTSNAPPRSTIFDYRKELNLTDDQVKTLKTDIDHLQRTMENGQKKIQQLEMEYRKLLESNPPIEDARKKLQEIANQGVEVRLQDLITSRKITATLTPAQLAHWREIQSRRASGAPAPAPRPAQPAPPTSTP
jgi:Spy/CpxP family protein refolding chaperone